MANGLATGFSDMDLVLILNDTYIEPQHVTSSNNSGESMNVDENSCSNDVEMHRVKVTIPNRAKAKRATFRKHSESTLVLRVSLS